MLLASTNGRIPAAGSSGVLRVGGAPRRCASSRGRRGQGSAPCCYLVLPAAAAYSTPQQPPVWGAHSDHQHHDPRGPRQNWVGDNLGRGRAVIVRLLPSRGIPEGAIHVFPWTG